MRNIAIIGGGASGIAAAIQAAEHGARVCVYEAGKRIGHSILVSGNGRCNFSNSQVDAESYWSAPFVAQAFEACPPRAVWRWLADLGLMWASEDEGRLYPLANKASSVLDVLRFRLDELSVRIECECETRRVVPANSGWQVVLEDGQSTAYDAVIVACGGKVARSLLPEGCRFLALKPLLCPLRTDAAAVKGLDNVRARAAVRLYAPAADVEADAPVAQEVGELQFRSYGISGIAAFNLSRWAEEGSRLRVDLLPAVNEAKLAAEIAARQQRWPARPAQEALAGMALPLVIRAVARHAQVDAERPLRPEQAASLAHAFKCYGAQVQGFETKNAQVHRGGVAVNQVDAATMQLKGFSGLHVTGEALDVDGPCGGYNLHWAWTSGLLAGAAAAGGGSAC